MADPANTKLLLPNFLKILTTNNVPVPKAMAIASKIYKEYNTPTQLSQLSELKLKAAGVDAQEDRRLVLTALRKAGYTSTRKPLSKPSNSKPNEELVPSSGSLNRSQGSVAVQEVKTSSPRKRKRATETNEYLPDGATDEAVGYDSLDFNEILDEEILRNKKTVVNRAPLLTAWAMLVAERMNFRREEALSIAFVYTEINAVAKGVSLGVIDQETERGQEAIRDGAQPYVELMGRSPLYKTQSGEWRALSGGKPVSPGSAFGYVTRAFRQTTPDIIGALRLLANSYSPHVLNSEGWGLYAAFRPAVDGWGAKAEVRCETILGLRKGIDSGDVVTESTIKEPLVKNGNIMDKNGVTDQGERERKKSRGLTLEEYEAALDQNQSFVDVGLDVLNNSHS